MGMQANRQQRVPYFYQSRYHASLVLVPAGLSVVLEPNTAGTEARARIQCKGGRLNVRVRLVDCCQANQSVSAVS